MKTFDIWNHYSVGNVFAVAESIMMQYHVILIKSRFNLGLIGTNKKIKGDTNYTFHTGSAS